MNQPTYAQKMRSVRDDRALALANMYRDGMTLQQIGDLHDITRERVRQILKEIGVSRFDGGAAKKAKITKENRNAARNDLWMRRYSISLVERENILRTCPRAFANYQSQKRNAGTRSIEWELTFAQWWEIWQASGKWNERKRGSGYVMARRNDTGPYAVGNIEIVHSVENSLQYYERTYGRKYESSREKWGLAA